MTTLYHRATPSQDRILRIIEGACKNVAHVHPGKPLTDKLARSISKRAAGTLMASWPEVLAARLLPSDSGAEVIAGLAPRPSAQFIKRNGWGPSHFKRRSPLRRLHNALGHECGLARRAGNMERAEALMFALRKIAEQMGR